MEKEIRQDDAQQYALPGQITFFPDMEPEPASHIQLQRPISPPQLSQLEDWEFCIIISDVLMRFDGRLPEPWLFDIMVGGNILNNFLYHDALGSLLETKAVERIREYDTEMIVLTESGRTNAKNLRLMVPKIFRDQVHLAALRSVTRQKALRDLKISYEPDDKDCKLCLCCLDHGEEMFFLRISTPSREVAEELGERILRNPARFFGRIIDLAMTNEEEPFDLTDN